MFDDGDQPFSLSHTQSLAPAHEGLATGGLNGSSFPLAVCGSNLEFRSVMRWTQSWPNSRLESSQSKISPAELAAVNPDRQFSIEQIGANPDLNAPLHFLHAWRARTTQPLGPCKRQRDAAACKRNLSSLCGSSCGTERPTLVSCLSCIMPRSLILSLTNIPSP